MVKNQYIFHANLPVTEKMFNFVYYNIRSIMKTDLKTFSNINRPMYILEERRLRDNLQLIQSVAVKADVEIILAFKAYALWKTFPIFREYIHSTTASSLYEAYLAYKEFGEKAHTYSPAYTDYEIKEISQMSSHLTFNSLSQYERYADVARQVNPTVSLGIRVNPEYSEVGTLLYNPCAPGTRFGVTSDDLPETLPREIEGFHIHCHCESGADVFERTLVHIEQHFSRWFPQLKWINFGGGHLMTRDDYDVNHLINILRGFHDRYPTCHMPDCLEMPYMPAIRGAEAIEEGGDVIPSTSSRYMYRIGGNSCLSGDFMGMWAFDHEIQVGENIIFEDMLHYTTVKTCMFNGIGHPSLALAHTDGELEILREYSYEDYKNRMD